MVSLPHIQYTFGYKEGTIAIEAFELLDDYLIDKKDGLKMPFLALRCFIWVN
jgi:hypothetical protein